MARPSEFSESTAAAVCERVADGRSLRSVCSDDDMPGRDTVRRWMREHESFAANIARAREESQHWSIDECREIAMEATPDNWLVAQLQIKTIQWEAGKRAPRQYGDKQFVEHSVDESLAARLEKARLAAPVSE